MKGDGGVAWGLCGGGSAKCQKASGCVLNTQPKGLAVEVDVRGRE